MKKRKIFVVATLTALLLAGCGSGGGSKASVQEAEPIPRTKPVVESFGQKESPDFRRFTYDAGSLLLRQGKEKNAVVSPLGYALAFGVLEGMASGETKAALQDKLGLPEGEEAAHYDDMIRHLFIEKGVDGERESAEMTVGNFLWIDKDIPVIDEGIRQLQKQYYTTVITDDFHRSGFQKDVEDRLEEATKGLLRPDYSGVDFKELAFVLSNVLTVKGGWIDGKMAETQDVFHGIDGDQTVTYLNRSELSSFVLDTEDLLSIRIANDAGTLTLLMPKEGTDTEALLEPGALEAVISSVKASEPRPVDLSFPAFRVKTSINATEMSVDLFGPALKEGTYETVLATPDRLPLGAVLQDAVFTADKEGIEGAAVTSVMVKEAEALVSDEPLKVKIDRPFYFVFENTPARDSSGNHQYELPLFLGVVNVIEK